jgi:protein TonB
VTAAIDPHVWDPVPKAALRKGGWQAGGRRWPVAVLGLILAVPLIGLAVSTLFTRTDPPKHKSVVQIALIAPPPPPPPPKPQEEPPKPKDEVKLDEPKPTPEEPKPMSQEPPPGPLGVDAQGTGPGDSFGLAGRPGGRDIVASGGGGLGWNLFGSGAAHHIAQDLARDPRLKNAIYRIEIRVWLSKEGDFQREEIVRGTGDRELDALIREGLRQLSSLHQPIPEKLPQPLRIRVTSSDS